MAQPSTRSELITYAKRQLGAPVLEINVADEQVEDLLDDAIQYFQERHFDGVYPSFLKYKLTEDDITRGRSRDGETDNIGITTTTATATIDGGTTTFSFTETANYLQLPDDIIGVSKVFHFDGSNRMSSGMFSLKYQLFLNDVYFYGSTELLTYAMTKTYLEDINFLLTTQKQIRFNKRQNRLYLDIDWSSVSADEFLVFDVFRTLNPNDYAKVYNDSFLKRYFTALVKRQWGQNLMKFQGVKLPGGVELNGRQIYDDAINDLAIIREQMSNTYEIPPLDFIG